ncbi:MAG: serine/threonine-protein kinase [Candidatus Eremiobacteraeota bacterium]|nr:serine/threonine-protein kinase [Candidatus Eremiobacteraeota bacterium]
MRARTCLFVIPFIMIIFVLALWHCPGTPAFTAPQGSAFSLTVNTSPQGAPLFVSYEKAGSQIPLGLSGAPVLLDAAAVRASGSATISIRHRDFLVKSIELDASYLDTHAVYPPEGAEVLDKGIRSVTFLTSPSGARVFQHVYGSGESRQAIGVSGHPLPWELKKYREGQNVTIGFDLWGYRYMEKPVPAFAFNDPGHGDAYLYPKDGVPMKLEPKVPLLIDAYYGAGKHPVAAVLIAASVALAVFGIILPWRRSVKNRLEKAALWEAIASRSQVDDPLFGRRLGRYRLVEKIGSGGMAAVYRAVPEGTLREEESVAIKVIHEEANSDEEFCERFKREMHITAAMNHPCILRVLDYGDEKGTLYLVMDLLRGKALSASIPEKGMDLATFGSVFVPLLEAVHYAHGKGIVHRDLKPENIWLEDDGRVIVMDFGIARSRKFSTITVKGKVMGTPTYMAPEQITGKKLDARADQYSLGIIAYQLLCGKPPFVDDELINIIYMHVTDDPVPIASLCPDLPLEVAAVVMRMLEKDRDKRFEDLQSAADSLRRALGEPAGPVPEGKRAPS